MDEFLARIRLERQLLEAVNARYGSPSLAGLSPMAVTFWIQADPTARSSTGHRLAELVETLSTQLYGKASRARMIDPEQRKSVDALLAELR